MIIYELPVSLYSFKLRLAMTLKGASVELRPPPGGTYRSAEYRAINPAGTIPALIDGAFVLAESDTIVEYLDDIHAGSALLPPDPKERARTRMLSRWCDMRLEPPIRALFPAVKAENKDRDAIAAADARIAAALDLFEGALDDNGPYALGTQPGLADCGLMASTVWLTELTAPLALSARPGAKFSRVIAAMRGNTAVAESITSYEALVRNWITGK